MMMLVLLMMMMCHFRTICLVLYMNGTGLVDVMILDYRWILATG